jgi:hypothetical protein
VEAGRYTVDVIFLATMSRQNAGECLVRPDKAQVSSTFYGLAARESSGIGRAFPAFYQGACKFDSVGEFSGCTAVLKVRLL